MTVQIQIESAILTLEANHPDQRSTPNWTGEYEQLSTWLPRQYGMYGHKVGEYPRPSDTIHALIVAGKSYQVLDGQGILSMPSTELPKGAVS